MATSLWIPLWVKPTAYEELDSFICDAQARLPGKEARFSAEFARALRAQGVDAGFAGWQEFRFKMRASDIPWPCTGRFLGTIDNHRPALLNEALAPLDMVGFLDQFDPRWKGNKIDSRSPHPIRAALNAAIENAIAEPTAENCLEILLGIYEACRKLTISKTLRDSAGQQVVFFDALPQEPWQLLLQELEHLPEFRISRALASVAGNTKQQKQSEGKPVFSQVQPFLGSLLPLKHRMNGWYLPNQTDDRSKQAVWTGFDLWSDLSQVLSRRYLDSLNDEQPALMSCRPAPLEDILAFMRGELDNHRIARWTEAMSLIGWRWDSQGKRIETPLPSEEVSLREKNDYSAIPFAYSALRSLLQCECEWQGNDFFLWKRRRSQRPIALVCQQTPASLALAVEDALHWLSIWGVPNCWGEAARIEKPRLAGRAIVRVNHGDFRFEDSGFVCRVAAAIAIPLEPCDSGRLFRSVALPQTSKH